MPILGSAQGAGTFLHAPAKLYSSNREHLSKLHRHEAASVTNGPFRGANVPPTFLQFHRPAACSPSENVRVVPRASAEGSSSVQTLGGMSGAIVVEDPEGSLPPEIEQMREVLMVLQETNIESGGARQPPSSVSEKRS